MTAPSLYLTSDPWPPFPLGGLFFAPAFMRERMSAGHLPQSSSASRFTAGASVFFILSQSGERPERYIESLRFDTMPSSPHLAGVGEDGRAVALDMLVEPDAGAGLGHNRRERGLADLKRIAPEVVAVQLDEVERVEEYALVSALVPDEIERSNAVVIAGDSFAIDDARPRAQMGQRIDDQREAAGESVARGGIEAHPLAALSGNDAEARVRDFVQPLAAGWQLIGFGWEARRDNPAGRVRCNIMPIVRGYSRASQSF